MGGWAAAGLMWLVAQFPAPLSGAARPRLNQSTPLIRPTSTAPASPITAATPYSTR